MGVVTKGVVTEGDGVIKGPVERGLKMGGGEDGHGHGGRAALGTVS